MNEIKIINHNGTQVVSSRQVADDKKLIEIYVAVIKDMSIKYGAVA